MISLSLVVKPVPVSSDITWKRAFSAGSPVRRKKKVNSSVMTQYTRMMNEKSSRER